MFLRPIAPSFLILGAEKSGTTFLYHYLDHHPQIAVPEKKEITFFNKDYYFTKGPDWYHQCFPKSLFKNKISFEASPGYLYYPWVAQRIREYKADMKLIAILREPVSRAYSAWNMHRQLKAGRDSFLKEMQSTQNADIRQEVVDYYQYEELNDFEALCRKLIRQYEENPERIEPSILRRGIYAPQLKRYLDLFPREQLLILESGELKKDIQASMDRICDFIGIKRMKSDAQLNTAQAHSRQYEAPISETAKALLKSFYAPFNRELFDLLKTEYPW